MKFKLVFKMFTSSRVGCHITGGSSEMGITRGVIVEDHHRRGSSKNVIMEGSSKVIMEGSSKVIMEGSSEVIRERSGEKIVNIRCWISSAAVGLQKDVKGPSAELAGTP